ncbi:MAG: oxidoreductase [Lachnospiraceae bacterium]|nr:oxidoreductase [Lachnospiraceae bacterium]
MNRSYRILPCYTGDVSGAASALYELGGMVVIHDPSGCNSTYNTHDETRWYDRDSLIYISGLSQREAIFGDDKKFIDDIADAAGKLKPGFIALLSSPIPFMNGTDFNAIAKLVEDRTGILTFPVQTNGMHDYLVGAGNAFEAVAKHLVRDKVRPVRQQAVKINILGLTPLDFTGGAATHITEALSDAGFDIVSTWSRGCAFEDVARSGEADVNLVVSATAYKAAQVLREKYGIPCVVGCPTGDLANIVYDMIKESSTDREDRIAYSCSHNTVKTSGKKILLIGEAVKMDSLAWALEERYEVTAKVACPLELNTVNAAALLRDGDVMCDGEEEIEDRIKGEKYIIADPMYSLILPDDAKILGLPHLAFSGRGFTWQRDHVKDIFNIFDDRELDGFIRL